MEKSQTQEIEVDLIRIAQVVLRNMLIIILVGVIFAGATYGLTKTFVDPKYEATAYMYVNSSNVSLAGTKMSISTGDLTAAKSLIDTYSVILKTRMTLDEVIERSGCDISYEKLVNMVSAYPVNGTEVLGISVVSTDPSQAELLANTVLAVLPEKISSIVDGSSVRVVEYAVRPVDQASPSYRGNALKGALVGILLAAVTVVVIDLMDEQIHDSEYLTKTYDLPVLANIPDLMAKTDDFYYYKNSGKRSQK